jgi:LPXTG-motif cell wall-anchored protein
VSDSCSGQGAANPSAGSTVEGQNANGAPNSANGAAGTGAGARGGQFGASVLGIASLPSTATRSASAMLLGGMLAGAGALLLRRSRRKS